MLYKVAVKEWKSVMSLLSSDLGTNIFSLFKGLPVCVCTWSLRVHCSVQISVMRFRACLAISSRNMLHNDRLRSPMWWRWWRNEGIIKSTAF